MSDFQRYRQTSTHIPRSPGWSFALFENAQVVVERGVEAVVEEGVKALDSLSGLRLLQRADIDGAVLGTDGDGRISGADQDENS
jgi:hypothetical protein